MSPDVTKMRRRRIDHALDAAHRLASLLDAHDYTVSLAESCTGGLVGYVLTSVPGISRFFKLGLIVYADESKEHELGVPANVLAEHGAVSEQTARAMAAGAAERTGSDLALAVTGIAGPGGGSEEKPVGLVYIAATIGGWTKVQELNLGPLSRDEIRVQSALSVLELGISILRSRPS